MVFLAKTSKNLKNMKEEVFLFFFVLIYEAEVHDFENTHYGSYWTNSQPCLPSGPSLSLYAFIPV